jgi:hypothetical protein
VGVGVGVGVSSGVGVAVGCRVSRPRRVAVGDEVSVAVGVALDVGDAPRDAVSPGVGMLVDHKTVGGEVGVVRKDVVDSLRPHASRSASRPSVPAPVRKWRRFSLRRLRSEEAKDSLFIPFIIEGGHRNVKRARQTPGLRFPYAGLAMVSIQTP